MDLAKVLADLRDAGVARARYTEGKDSLEVEFGRASLVAPAGFVDRNGKPVDLDEGMNPALAGDDDDDVNEPRPEAIEKKNHVRAKA